MNTAHAKKQEIARLASELANAKGQLNALQEACRHRGHVWGQVQYVPEHHPAYTIPGDPPGTMGVDRRGPCDVPSKTIPRWTRECSDCGLVQTTELTHKVQTSGSIPGTIATVNEPLFRS
jgi:hypothetical protein